ncbi:MAG TPA: hypothetical protein DCZ01_01075 [Elusimicrobia bacterium]|nr:MAG: hypothetical protein A2X37_03175 [Elusimicrobia bacterium GWA2_66_18]OGR70357.1 MAG: hypothetical protein A2X40_04285 [Elusimicrobia bacterium GWC2_65_9]HAZ07125.1 hypothetical protein [Elusimicrobiota bacterium]
MILKRLTKRYQCRIPVSIIAVPSLTESKGQLSDIGFGGAQLRTTARLKVEVRVKFTMGGKRYVLDGYVVRRAKDGGQTRYGVEFHTYIGKDLRALLAVLAKKEKTSLRSTIRMRRAT